VRKAAAQVLALGQAQPGGAGIGSIYALSRRCERVAQSCSARILDCLLDLLFRLQARCGDGWLARCL